MAGSSRPMAAGGDRPEPLYPKLAARPNGSAAAVAAHQRARLHAAMIEACARHGYAATTARELAALAGVSTKSIYRHFGSKDGCLLATYDVVVQQAVGRISAAYREGGGGDGDSTLGICRAFDAFAAELVDHPAASRLALVEILAAGPIALPRIERAEAAFATMIAASFGRAADARVIPTKLIRALIGGIWFVARARLVRRDPLEITASGAELREWLMSYRLPVGSALPLAPATRATAARPGRRVDPRASERSSLLAAAATVVARGGHAALSPAAVAELAGVPVAAFDAEFEDVDACFFASLEWLCADGFSAALREGSGAPSWGSGVYRAVRSLFCRIATDPALARAAFLDAFAVGPAGYERRVAILRGFAHSLVRRAPEEGRPPALVGEAIVGSIWSLAHRHVLAGRRNHLPALVPCATFLATAPIIGAESSLALIAAEHEP
jgi:AcrR family transcriptional regulator